MSFGTPLSSGLALSRVIVSALFLTVKDGLNDGRKSREYWKADFFREMLFVAWVTLKSLKSTHFVVVAAVPN